MTPYTLVFIGLWSSPIVALALIALSRKYDTFRKPLIRTSLFVSILTFIGIISHISTIYSKIDWLLVAYGYFTACLILWYFFFFKKRLLKKLSIIAMIFMYSGGYFSASLAGNITAHIINQQEPDIESKITDDLTYKESFLGGPDSNIRKKKIEIYKTLSWFPFLEKRIIKKKYDTFIPVSTAIQYNYDAKNNTLHLYSFENVPNSKRVIEWKDSIKLP